MPALRCPGLDSGFARAYRDGVIVLMGLITFAGANYNFDRTGALLPSGVFLRRTFAVNEFEVYFTDQWRVTTDLTLNLGFRYFVSSPPWEVHGNQVAPTPPLGEWFEARRRLMLQGRPTAEAGRLVYELAGPANRRRGYYDWDWNNLSPRVSFAYAPRSQAGWLGKAFGGGKFVLRGGYSLLFDRVGNALATTFDATGSFGLTNSVDSLFGGCDTGREAVLGSGFRLPCPRFTGVFDLNTIFPHPMITQSATDLMAPSPCAGFPCVAAEGLLTVAGGLDSTIQTPYSHVIDFSLQRQLPGGFVVEGAYVGRRGRRLLFVRDYAQHADLCAFGRCGIELTREIAHIANDLGIKLTSTPGIVELGDGSLVPLAQVFGDQMPYWENLFPGFGPSGINGGVLPCDVFGVDTGGAYSATEIAYDYVLCYHGTADIGSGFGVTTFWQDIDYFGFPAFMHCADKPDLDGDGFGDCPFAFFPSQFVNLHAWGSVARSEYHAFQFNLRKSMSRGYALGVNYTLAKSRDHGSTPERANIFVPFFTGGYTGSGINSWDIEREYSWSDFDMRHQMNAYWTVDLPFGRGRRLAAASVGGWSGSWAAGKSVVSSASTALCRPT